MVRPIRSVVAALVFTTFACAQENNVLDRPIASFQLTSGTLLDGIAELQRSAKLSIAVEHILPTTSSESVPQVRFDLKIENGTVRSVLDELVSRDSRFTWVADGLMINVFPKSLSDDHAYILNRIVNVTLNNEGSVVQALAKGKQALARPRQLAYLQAGSTFSFIKPFSYSDRNATFRHFLNRLVLNLGEGYGYQVSGSQEFKMLSFHAGFVSSSSSSSPNR
jgi:hypothetical protein